MKCCSWLWIRRPASASDWKVLFMFLFLVVFVPLMFCYAFLFHLNRVLPSVSTSELPTVLQAWGVFNVLTSTCASRHDSVQFFISNPPRWSQNIGKTQCFATCLPFRMLPTFSRACISFLLTVSLLWYSSYGLFLFPNSSHLCFSICPSCWKFDCYAPFGYYTTTKLLQLLQLLLLLLPLW